MNFAAGMDYSALEAEQNSYDAPIFLPFLNGERCPGWNDQREASFHGIKAQHTIQDLYQAVQEGILFNLFQSYLELIALVGKPDSIYLSGGILNSDKWIQVCADIFCQPLFLSHNNQASLIGALKLLLNHFKEKDCFLETSRKTVFPKGERQRLYQNRYERYLEAYNSFKQI